MDLAGVILLQLLPRWMQEDAADQGLAEGVDAVIRRMAHDMESLTVWDKIDALPEDILEELAWALNIEWWDSTAPIDIKRKLIKSSDIIHAHKGTPAAVERVVETYFGSGWIEEWFQYGGAPHHFKVFTNSPALVSANLDRFLSLLNKVKRKSSKLDLIKIEIYSDMYLYAGSAIRERSIETHVIQNNGLDLQYGISSDYTGVFLTEFSTVFIDCLEGDRILTTTRDYAGSFVTDYSRTTIDCVR